MGRLVELNCGGANYAGIEFHSNDANTTMVTYDSRIYSSGGTNGSASQGALYYEAKSHTFNSTVKIGTKTVATTDIVTSYALLSNNTSTITFANTMGLGTDTMGARLILYPGTGTLDWYGLGINSYTMVYNVPGLSFHKFYSAGTELLSVGQAYTTLSNSLSLISCITINHPNSSTLPTASTHIGHTYSTAVTLNFNFITTNIKNCATITLPALGVWMVVAKGVIQTSVSVNTQYYNDHYMGLSTSTTAFNTNPPAMINTIYYQTGSTGLGVTATQTQEVTRIQAVTSTVSPNANLYFLAQVTQIATGAPKITTVYYTYTRIA